LSRAGGFRASSQASHVNTAAPPPDLEDLMTINATAAHHVEIADSAVSEEKRALIGFVTIVVLLLGAMVAAGLTVGFGGVGAVAIAEAATMLVVCVFLTAG
jgi:hypothetical protein